MNAKRKQRIEEVEKALGSDQWKEIDASVENHGSIVLVRPWSKTAKAWLAENVVNEETQHWAGAIVVEPRYVDDLVAGMRGDGLTVS